VLANMVHFFLGLIILAAFVIGYRHWPDAAGLVWFPVVVVVQLIFTLALSLFFAALTVHFRDIRDLLSNLLMFWFFATPIIYSWQDDNVRKYKHLFDLNPFTHLAVSYQEILFYPGPFGHWKWLLGTDSTSGVVLAQQLHALAFSLAIVALLAATGAPMLPHRMSAAGIASAVASGLLYYAFAYSFYVAALRRVRASIAAASFYLIPVFGLAGGWLIGERLDARQWLGALVVVVAVAVITIRAARPAGAEEPIGQPSSAASSAQIATAPSVSCVCPISGNAVTSMWRGTLSRAWIHRLPWAGRRSRRATMSGRASGARAAPRSSAGMKTVPHSPAGMAPVSSKRVPRTRSAGSL